MPACTRPWSLHLKHWPEQDRKCVCVSVCQFSSSAESNVQRAASKATATSKPGTGVDTNWVHILYILAACMHVALPAFRWICAYALNRLVCRCSPTVFPITHEKTNHSNKKSQFAYRCRASVSRTQSSDIAPHSKWHGDAKLGQPGSASCRPSRSPGTSAPRLYRLWQDRAIVRRKQQGPPAHAHTTAQAQRKREQTNKQNAPQWVLERTRLHDERHVMPHIYY